jgi:hypothetical protein
MNPSVGPPRAGQWYTRWDRGDTFKVTGYDKKSGTIMVRVFDGRSEVLDELTWDALPLSQSQPPRGSSLAGADGQSSPIAPTADLRREVWIESLLG